MAGRIGRNFFYRRTFSYINGLALHWVIGLGAGIFLVLAVAANLIGLFFRPKHRESLHRARERLGADGRLDRVDLEVRFRDAWPSYRIGIYNPGPHVARGVEVWLERVSGQYYDLKEYLPHRLRTRDGKEKRCDINPETEELFEFARTLSGEPDNGIELEISGLRLDPIKTVRGKEHMVLRSCEHLHLFIRVSCENADPQTAIFFARPLTRGEGIGIAVVRID